MTWEQIDDVLYDGDQTTIEQLRCPDCGGVIEYDYDSDIKSFTVLCVQCGYLSKSSSSPTPNCVKLLGPKRKLNSKETQAVG